MHAIVLEATHQPVVPREMPTPTPGPDEVLIRVRAAALNHRDIWIQQGQYGGIRLPCILGADGAGLVAALGSNVRADAPEVGSRVVIYPGLDWGDNPRVQAKTFRVLGMPDPGTFAEYISCPARYVCRMPEHLSFEEAAALPLAGLTAYRAAFVRAHAQPGDRVLVTGIGGGVALLAAQLCAARGCAVWATSGSDDKLARAREMGILGGVNYKAEGWGKELVRQAGGPFNVIIDSAGRRFLPGANRRGRPGGPHRLVRRYAGQHSRRFPAKLFWKQLSLLGSTMGTKQDFEAMLALVSEKQLVPVVDRVLPLAEAEAAFRYLEAGGQFGKVVLKID